MRVIKIIAVICLLIAPPAVADVLIDEDFNDQSYSSPLRLFVYDAYDQDVPYSTVHRRGSEGYSIEVDHASGDIMAMLSDLHTHLDDGIYFRYWVYYPSSYMFPGEEGLFENVKLFKIAGTGEGASDVEFVYKSSTNPAYNYCPTRVQLYWVPLESGSPGLGGTGTGSTLIAEDYLGNPYLSKDCWHKIEIYAHVPDTGNSTIHLQIDDVDVYKNTNADVKTPASSYTGTQQFISIRASNAPPAGHGTWYFDDIYVASGEGNLCDSEEEDPSKTSTWNVPGTVSVR